ncbi:MULTISPECIES: DUF7535 family protein [Halomicrobium]|uniref:Uncharacterized protein n=2 Tax=Halomicrobium mukohataei TaxID=57705 RepID=C7P1A0_HALMD|nr:MULTISPECIES: hypothetical protein [Halomicrobium]ACV47108.1 conserved hypothetical protein [Halomicrobium mukohataei DSM 12286]QCD65591.1 hypothetical protein E5139_08055 [Halomicrobium mukohataei]QFR20397.1 hypothetical protein GBQ70_08050 [Halomicrobium sp. ZPS1]
MAAETDGGSGLRTVTPLANESDDSQMNAIGWLIFAGMLVVMLPVLPILALIWLVDKLTN